MSYDARPTSASVGPGISVNAIGKLARLPAVPLVVSTSPNLAENAEHPTSNAQHQFQNGRVSGEQQRCAWFDARCSALSVGRFLCELEQLQCLRRWIDDLAERLAQTKRRAGRVIEIVVVENHMQVARFSC